jgi:hypothetical protein
LTYLGVTHTNGIADIVLYGNPSDHIIAGDWNGEGVDTVGVYRPADHKFYLRSENSQGFADCEFWMSRGTWLPIAGAIT